MILLCDTASSDSNFAISMSVDLPKALMPTTLAVTGAYIAHEITNAVARRLESKNMGVYVKFYKLILGLYSFPSAFIYLHFSSCYLSVNKLMSSNMPCSHS